MKLFLAIAITLAGIFLLFAAAVDTVNYDAYNHALVDRLWLETIFGIALLAGGITWLHTLGVFTRFKAKSDPPPTR